MNTGRLWSTQLGHNCTIWKRLYTRSTLEERVLSPRPNDWKSSPTANFLDGLHRSVYLVSYLILLSNLLYSCDRLFFYYLTVPSKPRNIYSFIGSEVYKWILIYITDTNFKSLRTPPHEKKKKSLIRCFFFYSERNIVLSLLLSPFFCVKHLFLLW